MRITTKCKSCGKDIVFLFTNSGSVIPVDIKSLNHNDIQLIRLGRRISFRFGDHITHFATCPYAKQHRRIKNVK